jgi:hypothetical protein
LILDRPSHVVFVREATGTASIYVNNELHTRERIGGDLSNWEEDYPLVLGGEPTGERPWLGELYLVAIYSRALSRDEIRRNYTLGPEAVSGP